LQNKINNNKTVENKIENKIENNAQYPECLSLFLDNKNEKLDGAKILSVFSSTNNFEKWFTKQSG
jgi:hypothetical protein